MNENHASEGMVYRPRWLAPHIRSAVASFPVVVLTGARQVGKSTLLRHEFPEFTYRDLDDFGTLEQAERDPASLWEGTDRVILDEAQKAPGLFPALKSAVDRSGRKIRVLLSGSANLLLFEKVSESLAGRAVYFDLHPMTLGERRGEPDPPRGFTDLWNPDFTLGEWDAEVVDPIPLLATGLMPPLLTLSGRPEVLLWWEGYVRTYLERDLRNLSRVESLVDFRRLVDSLALRTGCVLNQSSLAREVGLSQATAHRYVKLLEVSNLVRRVPPYRSSRVKRITKSPKVFFTDPALSVYLSGYHEVEAVRGAREVGGFFETLVYLHLQVLSELMTPKARIHFWRTTTGAEVDFVIEHGKKALAFEVKLTRNPTVRDAKHLIALMEQSPQVVRGVLVHAGGAVRWLHSRVVAVPWGWLAAG